MKKVVVSQFIVLLVGTVFAWYNFGRELYDWLQFGSCQTGCAVGLINPFLTPCFYGAIFFLVALFLSTVLLRKVPSK